MLQRSSRDLAWNCDHDNYWYVICFYYRPSLPVITTGDQILNPDCSGQNCAVQKANTVG